jgi:HAD superfamily hydrolase (TIGR01509 family)
VKDRCKSIEAVIFDLDGLMVDSEVMAMESWHRLLAPAGVRLTDEQFQHLIGMGHEDSVRYVLDQTRANVPRDVLDQGFWKQQIALIDEMLSPMPGLLSLVEDLRKRGYILGVASNSPTHYVRKALAKIRVEEILSCVVGVDQVTNPKPAPDVYLKAADCLGMAPRCCLAFEDSPLGAQAAVAAGMRCVAIPYPGLCASDFDGVFAVFSSLGACHAALDTALSPDPAVAG